MTVSMRRVLVTGGSGYLGQFLVQGLAKAGYQASPQTPMPASAGLHFFPACMQFSEGVGSWPQTLRLPRR